MSNPFKEIASNDQLPPEVKEQTLSNLYSLQLVLAVVDLFAVKAGGTFTEAVGGPATPSTSQQRDASDQV
jgi:hypothetical protein